MLLLFNLHRDISMIAVAAVAVAVMVAAVAVVHITHFGTMPLCTPAG